MTIASQIQDYADGLSDAYNMVAQRGGTMPQRKNMQNLDTAIATIPSGSGGGATVFYLDDDFGLAPHIYTDSGLTTYATAADINNALDAGPVIIAAGSDKAEITAFNKTGGMANTGQWEFVVSPDAYVFSFVDNTNIIWNELPYQPKLTAGSNITISGDTISATDTTYSNFTGATSSVAGANGLVPAPAAGDQEKVLHGDGTWKDTTAKLVEMSYGESNAWAKFIAAYNAGSIVYCRASSGSNPGSGSQTRKAFMAYVNNATNPTNVEFQYVRSQSSKTDSQQCDQVFVYTLTNTSGGTWSVASRNMAPKIVAGTGMSSTFTTGANATITLNAEPDYSTSEVDTKVKWIDGKTIYRKVLQQTMPANTNWQTVATITGMESLVKLSGSYHRTDGVWTECPRSTILTYINSSSSLMIKDTEGNGGTAYIVIEYTKSS